jgi:hypothetical protein
MPLAQNSRFSRLKTMPDSTEAQNGYTSAQVRAEVAKLYESLDKYIVGLDTAGASEVIQFEHWWDSLAGEREGVVEVTMQIWDSLRPNNPEMIEELLGILLEGKNE